MYGIELYETIDIYHPLIYGKNKHHSFHMSPPSQYDSEVHNCNYHVILHCLEEKIMGFQSHQKESQVHFNFPESPMFLFSHFS